ncbi:plastocyanin/azurin family copper-binding protein [Undibacterium sp.]|uniref:cupredoxin domain-containing protein n=1 Tax=Undibacterium sp. TaxID=1914977 RepID=UPI00374FEE5D
MKTYFWSYSSIAAMLMLGMIASMGVATHALEVTQVATVVAVVEVHIINMKFVPERLEIKAGTIVKWVNQEKRTNHSVFFEKEGLAESDRLFPGETWGRHFTKTGSYPYICGPHPHMKAEIVVRD